MTGYKDFQERFKLLASKNQHLIVTTLSNIFTMRLIGNKTHGDLAEIGIVEFINQFMYDFRSVHVGKELFRAKEHEEDIVIINELTSEQLPVSLKAYGDGPLQLSTDKHCKMFPHLESYHSEEITGKKNMQRVFASEAFRDFGIVNVMPLIYRESLKQCNIMVFDHDNARRNTAVIRKVTEGKGRQHPVFQFLDSGGRYICEVRYGNATANALQRGLWTHTKNALPYFDSLTNGWIDYSHNLALVELFRLALIASEQGHSAASILLQQDIDRLKRI
ncbi:MAG: hypothetical protein JNL32_01985 [Candidatus Kapabacteria bacterium]|nr:hypothetical protein [Candidatus Kapabacteria bacterium]